MTSIPPDLEAERRRNGRKAVAAATAASSLEWYDFFIYGTAAALVFNRTFFDTGDPVVSAINSFASVAVAFVARPFGGIIAGHFGDKFGRKPTLVAAVMLMGIATFLIGFVPQTEIVWLAPLFLVILRTAQGLAIGAQWGGAMLLATEYAPDNRRGFYGSFAQVGVPVGVITGNLIFLALSSALAEDDFLSWGWRIPFWLSIVMLGVGLFIHKYLEDTPAFRETERKLEGASQKKQSSPVLTVLRHNGGTVLQAAGTLLVVLAIFYGMVIASLQYADSVLGIDSSAVLLAVLGGAALMLVVMPFAALASDIYGRALVYSIGLVGLGVWSFPMWMLFNQATNENIAPVWISIVVAFFFTGVCYGPQAALFGELFPAELRYSGASLGYQISSVLAGMTPMVMVALVAGEADNIYRFAALSVALVILALGSIYLIRRKQKKTELEASNA